MTAMGEVVTKADAIAFAAAEVRIALEAVALSLEPILSDLCAHGMSSDLREWIDDIDQREHAAVDGVQEKLRALAREYHP
jgi:Tfp pilus assembly protein PilP